MTVENGVDYGKNYGLDDVLDYKFNVNNVFNGQYGTSSLYS